LIWWRECPRGCDRSSLRRFKSRLARFQPKRLHQPPDNCKLADNYLPCAVRSSLLVLLFRDTVVNVAGGTVRAVGQLAGRWQASGRAVVCNWRLAQVPPALQAPNGTFKLSGTTESFKPETIRANGSGRVNIAGGTVTASRLAGQGLQLGRILPQLPSQLQGPQR